MKMISNYYGGCGNHRRAHKAAYKAADEMIREICGQESTTAENVKEKLHAFTTLVMAPGVISVKMTKKEVRVSFCVKGPGAAIDSYTFAR